jgi:hypothetical protein
MQYYQLAYKAEKGLNFHLKSARQISQLAPQDTVVLCLPSLQQQVDSLFETRILHQEGRCATLVVLDRKEK